MALLHAGFRPYYFRPQGDGGGRACIRRMRVTVSPTVNLVANGMGVEEIVAAYPYLEPEDVRQALQYAAWLAEETVYAWEPAGA